MNLRYLIFQHLIDSSVPLNELHPCMQSATYDIIEPSSNQTFQGKHAHLTYPVEQHFAYECHLKATKSLAHLFN
jgi:hypothetical protein